MYIFTALSPQAVPVQIGMIIMRHTGTQIIHTRRLVLRPFIIADARPAFASIYSNPRVFEHMRMQAMPSLDYMRERLCAWIEGYKCPEQYHWAVTLAETGELIGSAAVHEEGEGWEIGYCYAEKHWGHGYATEVLFAVCEFMFEKAEFTELCCGHSVFNPASARVIEKAGFKFFEDYTFEKADGTIVPGRLYKLKKEDF